MKLRVPAWTWRSPLGPLAVSVGIGLAACGGLPTEVAEYQLPAEDLSLDPQALVAPGLMFGCGQWGPTGEPSARVVLADVIAGPGPTGSWLAPEPKDLEKVGQFGGRVLKALNYPGFRIIIPTDRLPALMSVVGMAALTVPNPRRFDWIVIVHLSGPTTDADTVRFAELGGKVRERFDNFSMYSGWIPNRSIPGLRREARVRLVESSGHLCRQ